MQALDAVIATATDDSVSQLQPVWSALQYTVYVKGVVVPRHSTRE